MLAEIEQAPFPVLTPEPVPLNATLTYNSEAAPESKFTWVTDTGQPFLFVEEAGTTVTIALENATFATTPITFISASSNFTLLPSSSTALSFRVNGVPLSYFSPLILSFNVDADGVNGISSPPLLLVLPPSSADSASITLQYSLRNGSFTLDSMPVLASLDILTNTITPPFTITFNLQSDPPDPSVQFDPTRPLIGPSWMIPGTISGSGTVLPVSISSDASRFASIQFVLDVGSVTVTSPDPIVINATIGDG